MNTELTRCTFAIISHPDAGKTTVTEKLLWYGGVIRKQGMVKSKTGDYAKSDWMELEKQRGISVSSSVMSFEYKNRTMHLLDTPGHKDFSEDTYRTLTAVESVLMMIDSAKGVEEQTIKLMDVCRMRDTPIITFMNKFDREAMDPFSLIDNIEKILNIQCVPITWPIGMGIDFKGVYNLTSKEITLFQPDSADKVQRLPAHNLQDPTLLSLVGKDFMQKLSDDLDMISELIPSFSHEEYLAGIQTPVFFGSALHNFGVEDVLEKLSQIGPAPSDKAVIQQDQSVAKISPSQKEFSGFIFKIQANMDKKHRDRMAFLRICSGQFHRNQKVFHVRTKKEMKISSPVLFQAQSREVVDYACAGDIIGLHDTGKFRIGDTFTEGSDFQFTGIPSFAPEIILKVSLKDPLKGKHLDKGLQQLSEEGATQLFYRTNTGEKLLGAVGQLQFDVVKYRLADEYQVSADFEASPFHMVRWLRFPEKNTEEEFKSRYLGDLLRDAQKRLCLGLRSPWDLKLAQEKFPKVSFFNNSDYKSSHGQ